MPHRYKFKTEDPQATIAYNLNRVAEVWMDKYADIYYAMKPGNRKYGYGNITERVEWRKNHKCKSFKWYLDNVFSDFEVPHDIQVRRASVRGHAGVRCHVTLEVPTPAHTTIALLPLSGAQRQKLAAALLPRG